jgi:hypothetical protein
MDDVAVLAASVGDRHFALTIFYDGWPIALFEGSHHCKVFGYCRS